MRAMHWVALRCTGWHCVLGSIDSPLGVTIAVRHPATRSERAVRYGACHALGGTACAGVLTKRWDTQSRCKFGLSVPPSFKGLYA